MYNCVLILDIERLILSDDRCDLFGFDFKINLAQLGNVVEKM